MESQAEKLPRWEKLSQLVSDAIQSEEFRKELLEATIMKKLEILTTRYGFTDEELTGLDKDLKMLSNLSVDLAFRWY